MRWLLKYGGSTCSEAKGEAELKIHVFVIKVVLNKIQSSIVLESLCISPLKPLITLEVHHNSMSVLISMPHNTTQQCPVATPAMPKIKFVELLLLISYSSSYKELRMYAFSSNLKLLVKPMLHHSPTLFRGSYLPSNYDRCVRVPHFVYVYPVFSESDFVQFFNHLELLR